MEESTKLVDESTEEMCIRDRHMDCLLYPGNDLRVDARGVHLLPGAGVHRYQCRARLLAGLGALHGGCLLYTSRCV